MKRTFLLVCTAIILVLQSCVSAKVQANKQAGYNKKLHKLYIIINGAKSSNYFCTNLLNGFNKKLNEKNVDSEGFVRDPLSLETDEDIYKKISDYNPDALFVLKQTEVSYTNNALTGGKFEMTIIDGVTKKPVWKGVVEIFGSLGINNSLNTSVNNVINKLVLDKLI